MSEACKILAPVNTTLSESDGGMLGVQLEGGDSHDSVIIRPMFPVTRPKEFLSVRDRDDSEIGVIESLGDFPKSVQHLVVQHIQRRYFVPRIEIVHGLSEEHGYFMWSTTTDRGRREFYVKGRTDTIRVLDDARVFVTDVEDCRYEIPDVRQLPRPSQVLLERVI